MNELDWQTAVSAMKRARKVVVFTGAGVSAESGIPTFRDEGGFWRRFPPEKFANWRGLAEQSLHNPQAVVEFVLNVIEPIAKAAPNAGHRAIAGLECHVETIVVTQNIDGLHQKAGSGEVLEIHGCLSEIIEITSKEVVRRLDSDDLMQIVETLRDYSAKRTSLSEFLFALQQIDPEGRDVLEWLTHFRPNLVLFGDALAEPDWTQAWDAAAQCDVLISVGTSGAVYPAALLPDRATDAGATILTIDPQPMSGCWLEGSAVTILPELMVAAFGK